MTDAQWHLDKRVPIALFVTILAMFAAGMYQSMQMTAALTEWKTVTDTRLKALEKTDDQRSTHENRLVILEQQFSYIRADLAEIKTLLREQQRAGQRDSNPTP